LLSHVGELKKQFIKLFINHYRKKKPCDCRAIVVGRSKYGRDSEKNFKKGTTTCCPLTTIFLGMLIV